LDWEEESSRSTGPTSQTTCSSVDFWSLVTGNGGGWSSSGCRCKSRKDVCAIELVAGGCLFVHGMLLRRHLSDHADRDADDDDDDLDDDVVGVKWSGRRRRAHGLLDIM